MSKQSVFSKIPFKKLHSDRPRDTYLLYPGYNTYYIDDIDAWDVSGIPQANGDFIVPDNTIIKITKRSYFCKN